ncbi:hypothetical protein [Pedobacter yulinensis]|nr:hypothetical protein [Pedobacter yulinensis]
MKRRLAKFPEQAVQVCNHPARCNLFVFQTVNGDAREDNLLPGRGYAKIWTFVRTQQPPAHNYPVMLGYQVIHFITGIRQGPADLFIECQENFGPVGVPAGQSCEVKPGESSSPANSRFQLAETSV